MTEATRRAVTFAGAKLEHSRHVCAFFDTAEDRYRALAPFVKEGLERGEKVVHIVDPMQCDEHVARLTAAGVRIDTGRRSSQHETLTWEEAYLRDGYFDQDRQINLLNGLLEEGEREFPLVRLAAHMEWAVQNRPGVEQLVEYETRLNYTLLESKHPVICIYETGKFSGDVVMDILRTHPTVVMNGVVHDNPFFVPPDEFLKELRARRAARAHA